MNPTQLLRLEEIRRTARVLFEQIEDLEEEAYNGKGVWCGPFMPVTIDHDRIQKRR